MTCRIKLTSRYLTTGKVDQEIMEQPGVIQVPVSVIYPELKFPE
jgi:hypothetical protein